MRQLVEILPAVAETESTVLIEGEAGSGKELLAQAIHSLSSRGKKLFAAVICGALPDAIPLRRFELQPSRYAGRTRIEGHDTLSQRDPARRFAPPP
jgi:transcriptional regulator of aromatic amino acid metabolism